MKVSFRTLMLWLMMLATPLQGFAAATMMFCEPMHQQMAFNEQSSNMHETHHHDDASTIRHAMDDSASDQNHATHDHENHHGAGKCNMCSACCMLVAMTAPDFLSVSQSPVSSQVIPFFTTALRGFVPESLERPPRNIHA